MFELNIATVISGQVLTGYGSALHILKNVYKALLFFKWYVNYMEVNKEAYFKLNIKYMYIYMHDLYILSDIYIYVIQFNDLKISPAKY